MTHTSTVATITSSATSQSNNLIITSIHNPISINQPANTTISNTTATSISGSIITSESNNTINNPNSLITTNTLGTLQETSQAQPPSQNNNSSKNILNNAIHNSTTIPVSVSSPSPSLSIKNESNVNISQQPQHSSSGITTSVPSMIQQQQQQQQQPIQSINKTSILGATTSSSNLVNIPPHLNTNPSNTNMHSNIPSSMSDLKSSMNLLSSSSSNILGSYGGLGSNGLGVSGKPGHNLNFIDPLEHSLASLEQNIKHEEHMNHLDLIQDMSSIIPKSDLGNAMLTHQNLMHQLNMDVMNNLQQTGHVGLHGSNNGFNLDMSGLVPSGNVMSMGMPHVSVSGAMPSIFDPLPQNINRNGNTNNGGLVLSPNIPQTTQPSLSIPQPPPLLPKKEEKFLLTPKPIEDLLMNPNEKKMTPPDPKSNSFVQAFKSQEQNLKNASSWSSLASAGSPPNLNTSQPSSASKPKPMDSFQQFKKAKEKMDRMKMLERSQKEAAEKEYKRQQEEKHKRQEDMLNGRYVYFIFFFFICIY